MRIQNIRIQNLTIWTLLLFTSIIFYFPARGQASFCSEFFDQKDLAVTPQNNAALNLYEEVYQNGLNADFVSQHNVADVVDAIIAKRRSLMNQSIQRIRSEGHESKYVAVDLSDPDFELMLAFGGSTRTDLGFVQPGQSEHLKSTFQNGFLSLFETHTSNSENLSLDARENVETRLTGLKLSIDWFERKKLKPDVLSQWLKIHPKSGFLNLPEGKGREGLDHLPRISKNPIVYGGIVAVFHDEVKTKAIWTTDDTLELSKLWPFGMSQGDKNIEQQNSQLLDQYLGTFDKKILLPKTSFAVSGPDAAENETKGIRGDSWYYEALFFGPIAEQDVKYFMVGSEEYPKELEESGKPIYQWIEMSVSDPTASNDTSVLEKNRPQRTYLRKGKLLYSPP